MVSRAEFVEYLCEKYALDKEQIEAFGGANVACYTTDASTIPGRGGPVTAAHEGTPAPLAPGEGGGEAKESLSGSMSVQTSTPAASSVSSPSRGTPQDGVA